MSRKLLFISWPRWPVGARAQLPVPQIGTVTGCPVPGVQLPDGAGIRLGGAVDRTLRRLRARARRAASACPRPSRRAGSRSAGRADGARRGRRHRHHRGGADARAEAANSCVKRTPGAGDLGVKITVLQTPEGWNARRGLKRAAQARSRGTYDYNHVYLDGGATAAARAAVPANGRRRPRRHGLAWVSSMAASTAATRCSQDVRLHRFGCDGAHRAEHARHGGRAPCWLARPTGAVRAKFRRRRVLRRADGRRGRRRGRGVRLDGAREQWPSST